MDSVPFLFWCARRSPPRRLPDEWVPALNRKDQAIGYRSRLSNKPEFASNHRPSPNLRENQKKGAGQYVQTSDVTPWHEDPRGFPPIAMK